MSSTSASRRCGVGFPDAVELARMREQITDLQQRLEALAGAEDATVARELATASWETARNLFNDEGLAQASTNRIATELDISP
jgi:hypothetical protein